jgi:hypothetical protein
MSKIVICTMVGFVLFYFIWFCSVRALFLHWKFLPVGGIFTGTALHTIRHISGPYGLASALTLRVHAEPRQETNPGF